MTAPFTDDELATRVLKDLGLIGAEETPSSADLEWAKETCSSEIDLLSAKGIKIWGGYLDSVPNEYLTLLSRRIGLALAPSFGLVDIATATVSIEKLERDLRIVSEKPATGEVVAATHY